MNSARMQCLAALLGSILGLADAHGQTEAPPVDIPRLDEIKIDGDVADWGDRGFAVNILAPRSGEMRPPKDLSGRFRLGWNDAGMLLLINVTDDHHDEADSPDDLWQKDSVELFLSERWGGKNLLQLGLAPGGEGKPARHFQILRRTKDLTDAWEPQYAGKRTPTGYVLEVLLPWLGAGIEAKPGAEPAMQIFINDEGEGNGLHCMQWTIPTLTEDENNTRNMRAVRLADRASPPVDATVSASYENLVRINVQVTAVQATPSKDRTVEVLQAGRVAGTSPLLAAADALAFSRAELMLPLPPSGQPAPLEVRIDQSPLLTLSLPNLAKARIASLLDEELTAGYVFEDEAFPVFKFRRPLEVEAAIGRYRMDQTFYDSGYNLVKRAEKPGRYGAVIRIHAEDGRTFTRYCTTYRMAKWHSWWRPGFTGAKFRVTPAFGIDQKVVEHQSELIEVALGQTFGQEVRRSDYPARMLAGLSEMTDRPEDRSYFNSPSVRDRQWWVGLKRKLSDNDRRWPSPFVCPKTVDGPVAPVLHDGPLDEAGMTGEGVRDIDKLLVEWSGDTDEAFSVCIARNGVIVLNRSYGQRDGAAMTNATKSRMASLTKLIHGAATMMLIDQGMINPDANIDQYLVELKGIKIDKPATVRHLCYMTAGFEGHWGDWPHDMEHSIAALYPHFPVGKFYEYNGTSLELVGKVIEQMTGEALPRSYQAHLLAPLGMSNTDVGNASWDASSTAEDMARFGQMLVNRGAYGDKRFFSEATFEKMLPRPITDLVPGDTRERGFGCTWYKDEGLGPRTFGHGAASLATLRVDPDNKLVISMTRNAAGKNWEKYHKRFIKACAAAMVEPVK